MNHYPIINRTPPRACTRLGDTANPHVSITCPACRARLQAKVDSSSQEAAQHTAGSDQGTFFQGTKNYYAAVLAQ